MMEKRESVVLVLCALVLMMMTVNVALFIRFSHLSRLFVHNDQAVREVIREAHEALAIQSSLPPGRKAPTFSLRDTDGQRVTSMNFLGRKLLVMFSQVGCSSCEEFYSVLQSMTDSISPIVIVNGGGPVENNAIRASLNLTYPILAATQDTEGPYGLPESDIFIQYMVRDVPFFYVIDEEGIIVARGRPTSLAGFQSLIAQGEQQ